MNSYQERLANLRPLASRAELEDILPNETYNEHRLGEAFGFRAIYGVPASRDPRGIDTSDVVETISFGSPFPSSFSFYGFSIGMPLSEAGRTIEALGLKRAFKDTRYSRFDGQSPDGFDISVGFAECLLAITLNQPSSKAIDEARKVIYEKGDETKEKNEKSELERKRAEEAYAWTKIAGDDDAMLDKWAEHCKPWHGSSSGEFIKFADWLKGADPDERHVAAMYCNWDYGLALLLWIARRPDCDVATASYIFFGCEPSFYLAHENLILPASDVAIGEPNCLMIEIKERMDAGFYSRSEIEFDNQRDIDLLNLIEKSNSRLDYILPKTIKVKYEGSKIYQYTELNGSGLRIPEFNIK